MTELIRIRTSDGEAILVDPPAYVQLSTDEKPCVYFDENVLLFGSKSAAHAAYDQIVAWIERRTSMGPASSVGPDGFPE